MSCLWSGSRVQPAVTAPHPSPSPPSPSPTPTTQTLLPQLPAGKSLLAELDRSPAALPPPRQLPTLTLALPPTLTPSAGAYGNGQPAKPQLACASFTQAGGGQAREAGQGTLGLNPREPEACCLDLASLRATGISGKVKVRMVAQASKYSQQAQGGSSPA